MSEGYEWTKARTFLRGKYGAEAIVNMTRPIDPNGYWFATIRQNDKTFGVEFRKRGGKWTCRELRGGR